MSAIRQAIAAELEEARAAAEKALDRVQQLEELDAQATQLDDGEAPAAAPPSATAPAHPRRKTSTSAGRRPAPAKAASPAPSGQAHTASGAPTGGRRDRVRPEDVLDRVVDTMRKLGPSTPTAIGLEIGFGKSTSGMEAVREVVAQMVKDGKAQPDGTVRGRASYSLVVNGNTAPIPAERAIPAGVPRPSATKPTTSNPVDRLLEQILTQLALDGGRVTRSDLRDRLGNDVVFEDFDLALSRGAALDKIQRTRAGGVEAYELVKR